MYPKQKPNQHKAGQQTTPAKTTITRETVRKYIPIILTLLLAACDNSTQEPQPQRLTAADVLASGSTEGFARADQPRNFTFPQDHGPHAGFRNEWWYLTGNVTSAQGSRFGYQVTFFSTAIRAETDEACTANSSTWCTNNIWMGHVALSDVSTETHYASERFTRQEPALAGAKLAPFKVWLQDWQLFSASNDTPWELEIFSDEFALTLRLDSQKNPVLQGVNGLSQKSPEPGNASYYYSLTNLETSGEVTLNGQSYSVSGTSWLDREWGTSALAADQSGWDWFSLQFNDGQQLMYYQLRDLNGDAHASSSGNLTSLMGTQTAINPAQVNLEQQQSWRAPDGTEYTTQWRMQYLENDWIVRAVFADQLMDVTFQYWEGAVDIIDSESGEKIGQGYLEMVR